MRRHLCLLLFLLLPLIVLSHVPTAVSQPSWEALFREWMTAEDVDYGEETFELLSALAESKLNLNQVTREELEQLPFLSAQQIEDLMAYTDRYKPLRTLNELLMVESLDRDTRRLLKCFVCCDPIAAPSDRLPSLSSLLKDGRHTLLATVKIPMYERKGDSKAYLGYPYRHDLRYQFSYRDRIKFGLTGAQDAGEPFFANKNSWGYDYYSYYFQLRRQGRLEELNLGMYKVQLGMGLVMNTGFRLGKVAILQSLGRSSHVLTAHASRSSASYLRGAAATVRLARHWRLTAFASYRPLDATLNDDNQTVRTIVTDGYHRTATELAKKNNTHLADLGLRLGWKGQKFGGVASANVNVVYSHFDRTLVPYIASGSPTVSQLYRRYALAGNDFLNASLDYSYTHHRVSLAGETAVNRNGALAALHTLSYRLTDQWSLMLLHRYYDKRYTAYHAYAFSEGSNVQNEHGLYLGAKWVPSRNTLLQAYLDYVYFPWARYQVSSGSESFDAFVLARSLLYNIVTVEARYRFHLRQRDNDNHTLLMNRYEHRARLRASLPLWSVLTLATQADAVMIDNRTARSRGLMVSQFASYQHRWLKLSANVGWFRTDDYDSRLYQYEPSVLYDFSFPVYYGHGLRYALTARADAGRFMFSAKVGTTNYFDRAVISSGQQQVNRSSMTDLLLQLRMAF
ncbi:MAG: helix-hairpin-helix domain-containing protein [Prevotella sp.]|nr:helix-hairpin-helix domain-containing protein [Prevotella sp.]